MLSFQLQHSQASRQAAKAAALGFARTISSSSSLTRAPITLRAGCAASQQHRLFSSTPTHQLRDFFPVKETPHIQTTKPAWPHEGYTYDEMLAVEPAHRPPRTVGDYTAWKIVRFARYCMDKATGMDRDQKSDKTKPTTAIEAEKPLTEAQWLIRFIFLESVAGVPGMVGGMLRHLGSLRRMKRDNGWIETLLEESYNERMHLLTFMKMCEPGWFMKMMIIGAQGVFFNSLFVSYLISPKIVHRFVGYLEEEAVHTYTRCIKEIEDGNLPKWSDPKFQIPDIAIQYWKMPKEHRTMNDLILYIRADEATHRGVNHTLGNLNQTEDPNPFVSEYKDREPPKPALKPTGYDRVEVI
ncbi:inducible alternative oxidase 2 [Fusarium oxysporum]|nr:inducible alternative oxidase 2 [Fusarium oxysporum]KAJ4064052.1 inducible alternative oxidase 2 [Fusarium oxysporum]KAJ4077130.1 inducible alternative oxidase 2 [Fusarium oxysporum]